MGRFPKTRFAFVLVLISFLVSSCQQIEQAPAGTPTRTLVITPYHSPTHTSGVSEAVTSTPTRRPATPTIPPPPTATPIYYEIQRGDTLLGLALRYHVSLEALQDANPDVDPNFLSVGTEIIIPLWAQETGAEATPLPTPTPLPLATSDPYCYPDTGGGAWCFALVENEQETPIELATAWMTIYDGEGEPITGTMALAPLNVIAPGVSMPLTAFFPPPLPASVQASIAILTALPLLPDDQRYVDLFLGVEEQEILKTGLEARVQGTVRYLAPTIPSPEPTLATGTPAPTGTAPPTPTLAPPSPAIFSVVVIAYGEDDRIVGVREWESDRLLMPEESLSFELSAFSLGPPIARVQVLAEGRRAPPLPTETPTP